MIRWQAPASNGGRPITAYVVRMSVPGTGYWRIVKVTSAISVTLGGLVPGQTYCYSVYAVNVVGAGYAAGNAFATAGAAPEPEGRCWRQILVYDAYVRAVNRVKAIWAL